MNRAYLVFSQQHLENLLSQVDPKGESITYIACNSEAYRALQFHSSLPSLDLMNLIEASEFGSINRTAEQLAEEILAGERSQPILSPRSFVMKQLFRVDMTYYLVWVFKHLLAFEALFQKLSLQQLILPDLLTQNGHTLRCSHPIDPSVVLAAQAVAKKYQVKTVIRGRIFPPLSRQRRRENIKNRLRPLVHLARLFLSAKALFHQRDNEPWIIAFGDPALLENPLLEMRRRGFKTGWWSTALWVKRFSWMNRHRFPVWHPNDQKWMRRFLLQKRSRCVHWKEEKARELGRLSNQGLSFRGYLLFPLIRDRIELLWDQLIPETAEYLSLCDRFLSGKQIAAVIVDQDIAPDKKGFVALAKEKKIPTLVVMHGFPASPAGYAPLTADVMATWGGATAKRLMEWGIKKERIVITGNPKYDQNPLLRVAPMQDPSAPLQILIASQPLAEHSCLAGMSLRWPDLERFYGIAMEGLSKWGGECGVGIKLHPLDPYPHWTEEWVKRWHRQGGWKEPIPVYQYEPAKKLLSESDVVLSMPISTMVVEALALGKPVIVIGERGRSELHDFVRRGMAWGAGDAEGVAEALTHIAQQSEQHQKFLESAALGIADFMGPTDQRASERIGDALEEWMRRSRLGRKESR